MLPIIIGALAPFTAAPAANPVEPCATAAIVVVHYTQPTPCTLDGSQVLVTVGGSRAHANHAGGDYLGFGITWNEDY